MVGGIHICQNNKCCHTNALYTTIQGKNSNIYSNITANLEEPQCMPIMQTLVNLFYLSLMTDTLQEDGGIGGEPARGSPMQATTG